ncbi:MAG: hypothetical protein ABGX43_02090, partial [Nitrospinaceae bacterium]
RHRKFAPRILLEILLNIFMLSGVNIGRVRNTTSITSINNTVLNKLSPTLLETDFIFTCMSFKN